MLVPRHIALDVYLAYEWLHGPWSIGQGDLSPGSIVV